MKDIELPLPGTLALQREIVEGLKSAFVSQDDVIARTEREIALLREYRARLIADVVTGKLDVHEVAARLPQEHDEPPENDVDTDADAAVAEDEPEAIGE